MRGKGRHLSVSIAVLFIFSKFDHVSGRAVASMFAHGFKSLLLQMRFSSARQLVDQSAFND